MSGRKTREARRVRAPSVPTPVGRRPNAKRLLGVAVVAAIALVGAIIGVSLTHGRTAATSSVSSGSTLPGAAAVNAGLHGIPQDGLLLGAPTAPVRLVEYLDLQCPWCGLYARDTFPEVVSAFVRTGKVQVELRPLAFVGSDSVRGRAALLAAAHRDKAFQFVSLLYANQGTENTGWLSTAMVQAAAGSIPGLDAGIASSVPSNAELTRIEQQRARDGVTGVPTFVVQRRGEQTGGTMLVNPDRATLEAALRAG